jgi:hypothetical protein
VSENEVEWARNAGVIEGLDEESGVANLPATAAAHETLQLLLWGASSPLRLLLESAEGPQVTVSGDDPFDPFGPVRADQLVLQILHADVEAQRLHVGAGEIRAEPGPLETAPEVDLLCGVAEAGQLDVESLRAELMQVATDRLRTADRYNGNALGTEVPASALRQRFDGGLVADPFDEHHCAQVGLSFIHGLSSPRGVWPEELGRH